MPTSMVFDESIRPVPNENGRFDKGVQQSATVTDAFKRLENPLIEKMKTTSVHAKNLGPNVPELALNTFHLLKNDPAKHSQQVNKQNDFKEILVRQVDDLVKQREEFHN